MLHIPSSWRSPPSVPSSESHDKKSRLDSEATLAGKFRPDDDAQEGMDKEEACGVEEEGGGGDEEGMEWRGREVLDQGALRREGQHCSSM